MFVVYIVEIVKKKKELHIKYIYILDSECSDLLLRRVVFLFGKPFVCFSLRTLKDAEFSFYVYLKHFPKFPTVFSKKKKKMMTHTYSF